MLLDRPKAVKPPRARAQHLVAAQMNTEIVQADFGAVTLTLLVSLATSAIPAILAAIHQRIRKKSTKVTIKVAGTEITYDVGKLNSKDIASIIDTLADKSNGRQAKT